MREEGFEQHGRAEGVGVHVAADLVHRLADSDLGRLMEDRVDAVDGACHEVGVGDVALQELDAVGNVLRAARVMDLGDEAVDDAHGVTSLEQRLGEMRPDEPGPPVTSTRSLLNPAPLPFPFLMHRRLPMRRPGAIGTTRQDTDLYDSGQQNISSWMLSGSRNTSTPP